MEQRKLKQLLSEMSLREKDWADDTADWNLL